MDRVALDLGFIKIYWYSITMLLGISFGSLLAFKEAKRQKINIEKFSNMIFYVIVFGLIGARIYYVLFNLSYYLSNPLEILAVWNGGLAIHGGILAGLLVIAYFCKDKDMSLYKILDILAVGLILGQVIGRWGNFFNGEAHGGLVNLEFLQDMHLPQFIINGMYINGNYYHPTFLYESVLNLIAFIIMLVGRRKFKIKEGMIVSFYLIWYSVVRFIIEGLRTDSLMFLNLKQAQIISIFMFIVGIILLFKTSQNKLYNKEAKK